MTREKDERKLTNFLINPSYQLKYVFWTTFSGFILVSVNAYVFYYFTRENYKILVDLSPMEDNVKTQLYHELHQIIFSMGGMAVLFTVIMALVGVILSHRTAGPMFHFKRVFREIRGGNNSARIKLRPRDDFRDVADEFNKMIDSLQKR